METPGMPSMSNTVMVYGADSDFLAGLVGLTLCYDKDGYLRDRYDNAAYELDWSYSIIYMNTESSKYGLYTKTRTAKMTFMHEVGHVLKLSHPAQNSSYEGHTYNGGKPLAVMNQGAPGFGDKSVAEEVAQHDKDNLIAKWGA